MIASPFSALRRRIAAAGARTATTPWSDLQQHVPLTKAPVADVIERPFRHHDVGAPVPWDEVVAFLDGSQRAELVGYVGIDPVVAAVVRAAVRIRRDRRTTVAVEREQRVVVARPQVLDQLSDALAGHEAVAITGADPSHPIGDLDAAHRTIDDARASLEVAIAREFRLTDQCWLIADGSLALSPEWTSDGRMIGVVKSPSAPALDADLLETFLTLPAGHRTSVFAPRSQQVTPLYAFGLRLWPWEGRDLFHGLVRVEIAATPDALANADALARFILAERAPLTSMPRGDRLLYGIHDVGRYLRSSGAAR